MDSIWFILGIIGVIALSLVFEHYYLKTKAWTYRILEKKDSKEDYSGILNIMTITLLIPM